MNRHTTSKTSKTDWERADASADEQLDQSEHPEMTDEMFARSVLRKGLKPLSRKQQITLRLDADILAWFKSGGRGYQSRINALLREYMKAHTDQNR